MNTVIYITVNLFLIFSWYIYLLNRRDYLSYIDRMIATFILSLSQIIFTGMLLGVVFLSLYPTPLFILNITISIIVLISSGSKSLWISCRPVINEIKDSLIVIVERLRKDIFLSFISGIFLISILWTGFLGYLFPPYSWDSLWYHLPTMGYIMQSGAIQEFQDGFFINRFINIFPKNIELFFLWNTIFLKNTVITDLSQVVFAPIGVLALYSLAIKLDISKRSALFSALLFYFIPILILQLTTNHIDVAISVLFVTVLNFLAEEARPDTVDKKRRFTLLLSGITSGILLGSKGSGPLFVTILSALVVIQEFRMRRILNSTIRETVLKVIKVSGIYYFFPVLLFGGFWYLKNWALYGNPVYPMDISIAGITIFKGLYKGMIESAPDIINSLSPIARAPYVWLENIEYYLYDSRLGGLGPLWFILFIPSVVFSFIHAVINKKYRFLSFLLMIFAAFLLYPRNWTPRYVIFIVASGALSFGFVLDYFRSRENVLKTIALLLVIYTFVISNSPCITPQHVKRFMSLESDERSIAKFAPFNIDMQARQEYGYWEWINGNVRKGETVAYTFEPLFLAPLWNSSFTSRIAYLKSDSYNSWVERLGVINASYLLIKSHSVEDRWVDQNIMQKGMDEAVMFSVVYSDRNYKIVRVDRAQGKSL